MPVSTRIIKRRMKSVANTKKITNAMELVAGAKMRKSVQMTLASRDYAITIRNLVENIRSRVDPASHPLLVGPASVSRSLVAIASSDRGLCGGFNAQILKKTFDHLRGRAEEIRVVTIGHRAEQAVKRAGIQLIASFDAISNAPSAARTRPIGELLSDEFLSGRADRVFLVAMDFKNAVTHIPTVTQLLPIIPEDELLVGAIHELPLPEEPDSPALFEPNPHSVLDTLLPRLVEMQIYQALLESSASEHSSRMFAMRSATENASDMLQDLAFTYNQARQATITREISEISAGKAAIE